jgi:hypothetical protein
MGSQTLVDATTTRSLSARRQQHLTGDPWRVSVVCLPSRATQPLSAGRVTPL